MLSRSPIQGCEHGSRFPIRRALPADAENIIIGINTICAEGGAFYTTQFVSNPQWDAVLYRPETAPDHLLAVAECDGRFAGAGQVFPGSERTLFRHVGELGLFVLKPYRGRGIGKRLLLWMLDWAKSEKLQKVTLSVFATNRVARDLYAELGFVEEGCRRSQFKINGAYIDEILMALFLDRAER